MSFYGFLKKALAPIQWMFNIKIKNKKNIPKQGPIIFALNHPYDGDGFMTALCLPRKIAFLIKKEVFNEWFRGFFVKSTSQIATDRNNGKSDDIVQNAIASLQKGRPLGIFPEGTTRGGPVLRRFRTGVARIAAGAQVPVLPIVILRKKKKNGKIAHYGMTYVVGTLIPPPSQKTETKEEFQAYADKIKAQIISIIEKHNKNNKYAHLLPP